MVGIVTWPKLVSDHCNALSGIFLDAPDSLKGVLGKGIEELMIENAIIAINKVPLFLAKDRSKVDIAFESKGLRSAQSLEAFVASHFMKGCHLQSSQRDRLTFLFNCPHQV